MESHWIEKINITIVGLGLIGGSFARGIKKLNPKNLWAVDLNEEALKNAEEEGIINKGFKYAKEPLMESDLVILSIYPKEVLNFIHENVYNFKKEAIITDCTSVKGNVVYQSQKFLRIIRRDLEFLGGHPMAGGEKCGFKFSNESIFKDSTYIITPTKFNKKDSIEKLSQLTTLIGFKEILQMSPDEHDKMVAFASHLPHILAFILVSNRKVKKENFCFGGSFKDATRVAFSSPELWTDIIMENSFNVLEELGEFQKNIKYIENMLKNKDRESLSCFLENINKEKSIIK